VLPWVLSLLRKRGGNHNELDFKVLLNTGVDLDNAVLLKQKILSGKNELFV
jgi:hypothetical protein